MTELKSELLEKLQAVKRWSRGDERAPHKPLLLLLALGRIQSGKNRLVDFKDLEYDLKGLIENFGPARKSYHAEFPFWHLQSDGLWELPGRDLLQARKGGNSPTVGSLRENNIEGGLPAQYFDALKGNPELLVQAVQTILDAHFPESLHDDLLSSIGITLEKTAVKRDPEFRNKILLAYNWRCAVCGFHGRLDNAPIGVEAAHVKWHAMGGPSDIDNGLCLCALHHKALDRGVIALDDNLQILVSDHLEENDHTVPLFFKLRGHPLVGPRDGHDSVRSEYRRWHLTNCYRG